MSNTSVASTRNEDKLISNQSKSTANLQPISNLDRTTSRIIAAINSVVHFFRFNAGIFNCTAIIILFLCITFPSFQLSQITSFSQWNQWTLLPSSSLPSSFEQQFSSLHELISDISLSAQQNITDIRFIQQQHEMRLDALHRDILMMQQLQEAGHADHPTITQFTALTDFLSEKDQEWIKSVNEQQAIMEQQVQQMQALDTKITEIQKEWNQKTTVIESNCHQQITSLIEDVDSKLSDFRDQSDETDSELHTVFITEIQNMLNTKESEWTNALQHQQGVIMDQCHQDMMDLLDNFKSTMSATNSIDSITKSVATSIHNEWYQKFESISSQIDALSSNMEHNVNVLGDGMTGYTAELTTIRTEIKEIQELMTTLSESGDRGVDSVEATYQLMTEWEVFQSEIYSQFSGVLESMDNLELLIRIDIDSAVAQSIDALSTATKSCNALNDTVSIQEHSDLVSNINAVKQELNELRVSMDEIYLQQSKTIIIESPIAGDNRTDYSMKVLYHTEIMTDSVGEQLRMRFWYHFTELYDQNAVTPTRKWGDCTPLKMANEGDTFVILKLKESIFVNGITIEHMKPELSGGDIQSAPKEMRLELSENGKYFHDVTNSTIAGNLVYDPVIDGDRKYFAVDDDWKEPCQFAKLNIESNHGGEFTCLYRVQIHGEREIID